MKRTSSVPDWAKPKIKNARIPSPEGSAEDGGADADYVPSSKEIEEKNNRRLAAIAAMPVEDFNASQESIVKEVERMRPRVPAGWDLQPHRHHRHRTPQRPLRLDGRAHGVLVQKQGVHAQR